MPVDTEKWRAGIGNFNGCCQYPVARFELRVYNIFSATVRSAYVFLLILLCISNLNMILDRISEMYFDSSILEGDSSFQLDGYKVIRADHPSNTKRQGVCFYYKESLSV